MSNSCEFCGWKNSEVRPGGGVSEKGKTISLTVKSSADLSRDVIKSDSAVFSVPSLDLTVNSGTAMITTVEGLVRRVIEDLKSYQFCLMY